MVRSVLENKGKSSEFIGLIVDGKHVWQQEEEHKRDSSTALMIQE